MSKSPNQHYYMQTVLKDRLKFMNMAQKLLLNALNLQIKPVLNKVDVHHGPTDHLIKTDALKDAFKKIYTDVGSHFAKAQYDSLMMGKKKSKNSLSKKSMRFKDDDEDDDDEPTMTGPHSTLLQSTDEAMDEDEFDNEWRKTISDYIDSDGAEMITNITDSTKNYIKEYISEAIKNGTSAAELASDMRDHFADFNRSRSMLIARTEIARAQNFATNEGAKMTGLELTKTWLHAGNSPNDRDDHADADGQEVDFDDTFDINSDYAPSYPHDGSGGADEEANCNCTFFTSRKKD